MPLNMRAATATALGAAAAHANLLADQEEREIEHLMATIIEAQVSVLSNGLKNKIKIVKVFMVVNRRSDLLGYPLFDLQKLIQSFQTIYSLHN